MVIFFEEAYYILIQFLISLLKLRSPKVDSPFLFSITDHVRSLSGAAGCCLQTWVMVWRPRPRHSHQHLNSVLLLFLKTDLFLHMGGVLPA